MKSANHQLGDKIGHLFLDAAPKIDSFLGCIIFAGKPKKPDSLRKKEK